jgi:hypothetical protein
MTIFFFHHSKTFSIKTFKQPEDFKKEFFRIFRDKLKTSYVSDIVQTEDTIRFKAPIARFAWNGWNVFNPVSRGSIYLKSYKGSVQVKYQFCFLEFLTIALLMSIPGIVALSSGLQTWGIIILIADWLGFYAISRAISAFRLNSLIAGIVQSVNDPKVLSNDFDRYLKEEWRFIDKVFFERHYKDAVG